MHSICVFYLWYFGFHHFIVGVGWRDFWLIPDECAPNRCAHVFAIALECCSVKLSSERWNCHPRTAVSARNGWWEFRAIVIFNHIRWMPSTYVDISCTIDMYFGDSDDWFVCHLRTQNGIFEFFSLSVTATRIIEHFVSLIFQTSSRKQCKLIFVPISWLDALLGRWRCSSTTPDEQTEHVWASCKWLDMCKCVDKCETNSCRLFFK